jgi:hypothetical protein
MSCDCFQQSAQGLSLHLVTDSLGGAEQNKKRATEKRERKERREENAVREYFAARAVVEVDVYERR